jgi:dihydrofolate synthase/folylpolyglutamate synthase
MSVNASRSSSGNHGGILDYDQAIYQLLSLPNSETGPQDQQATKRFYNLDRINALMERLGNPQNDIPTIHIAGTKGKGSTAAMITSILTAAGYKVGLFTSPHIHEFRERIRIGLEPISKELFGAHYETLSHEISSMENHTTNDITSVFETLVAMAFTIFSEENVDFQVLEAGLGGRLDATNILHSPLACVITSLSLDHTRILGDSIQEIAHEKAGIVKLGVPLVSSPQTNEAMKVIEQRCSDMGALLYVPSNEWTADIIEQTFEAQTFQILNKKDNPVHRTPLLGNHQIENAIVSLKTIDIVTQAGHPVSQAAKYQGLANVQWAGRFQVLSTNPLVITDGAHNVDSAKRLRETVSQYITDLDITLIFGCGIDKDASNIAKELSLMNPKKIITTRSRHPKAFSAEEIRGFFERFSQPCTEMDSVASALTFAIASSGNTDAILVTGSLFIASEAIEWATGKTPELYTTRSPVL